MKRGFAWLLVLGMIGAFLLIPREPSGAISPTDSVVSKDNAAPKLDSDRSEPPASTIRTLVGRQFSSAEKTDEVWDEEKLLVKLRHIRRLLDEQGWERLGNELSIFFEDLTRIENLADLLSDGTLSATAREDIEWLLGTTMDVYRAMLSSEQFDPSASRQFMDLFHKVLGSTGTFASGSGKRLLKFFAATGVLDESFLATLASLRQDPDLAHEAGLAIIGIAVRTVPPRQDLLDEFLDGRDPDLLLEALRAIAKQRPDEGGERAIRMAREGRLPAERRAELFTMIASRAQSDIAMNFLVEATPGAKDSELVAAFHALHARGLGDLAAGRYAKEENSRVRKFLLVAASDQTPLLDLAVETDPDPENRGQALMLLAIRKPDAVTGHRILDQLNENIAIIRGSTQDNQPVPLATVLFSLEGWVKSCPQDLKKGPIFEQLMSALKPLVEQGQTPPDIASIAQRLLDLMPPGK